MSSRIILKIKIVIKINEILIVTMMTQMQKHCPIERFDLNNTQMKTSLDEANSKL